MFGRFLDDFFMILAYFCFCFYPYQDMTKNGLIEGEFDDGLDDELMGDAEDRKRLQLMTEKEREEEIFKRAEKREMLKKRYEIEKKLKLQKRSSGSGSNDNTVKE